MTSTIKVDNIQDQDGNNIINENANTITIGASGDTVTLASGASQSGFGRSGTVDWQTTKKTANFTAVSGEGYFVDTSSSAITVTLPASPSAGAIVSIADYTNTFATNPVTVGRNSEKIGGVAADASLGTDGLSVTFVYVDSTEGWKNVQDATSNVTGNPYISASGGTITTCGDYKIHTFTSPGTFTVSGTAQCSNDNTLDYVVIAGGGGSSSCSNDGGGGAGGGGFRLSNATGNSAPLTSPLASPTGITATATAYPITVGAGGTGGPSCATAGSNSVFSTITSAGGGKEGPSSPPNAPAAGGSGGAPRGGNPSTQSGGAGNTPPVSPPQGNNGGSSGGTSPNHQSGGGGGAGGTGTNSSPSSGGKGGIGSYVAPSMAGTNGTTGPVPGTRYFSGGGGGAGHMGGGAAPDGGGGGQGSGGNNPAAPTQVSTAGTANTGGGGGGGSTQGTGKAGGSGIVIIRYKYQ